ncbi:MAG: 2-oxo acid dehydrogenase subunit E2 [Acidimicrobiia bacterium]|nr:2-oxo acid dehydrogenase subunit E2 [Acidimicrobiia bacterium]
MAHRFLLPDVGEGLTEAVIVHWHVDVGEAVTMDGPLVEVETDKAVVDIPAPHGGVLLHRGGGAGETLAVGSVLAVIGDAGEAWDPPADDAGAAAGAGDAGDGGAAVIPTGGQAAPIVGRLGDVAESVGSARPGMLPKARRLAVELGVDTSAVVGTGPGGRITEDDLRRAAAEAGGPAANRQPERPPGVAAAGPERRVRMSPTRRSIADNLARSWREIPHVTTYSEADAGALLAARTVAGKPPLEALLIARMVPLLQRFPDFNAAVDGDEIVHKLHYDVGVAVDTPDGLLVTVVRDADRRDIAELGEEIVRLATAARERKAKPNELRGQTFTLSNIGAVGGRYGTPIVPYGTTAILSVGRADPTPVVRGDDIVIGLQLPLSLSYDHRAIDGSTGRAFMAALVECLEA